LSDELTVSFPYVPAEHAHALSEGMEGRKLPRRMRAFGITVGVAGVLTSGFGVATGEPIASLLENGVSWLALGGFWYWVGPALLKMAAGRQLRRDASEEGREVEHLSFSDAGFSPSSKWAQPMPWSFVERVVETERFLLIHHSYAKEPFYVPKHALSLSERERLVTLFRTHLNVRPQQLQLRSEAT
jgi:hypothetical protein